MITVPVTYLPAELQSKVMNMRYNKDLHIDNISLGYALVDDTNTWVYLWTVFADPSDSAAVNAEFQKELEYYVSRIPD